MIYKWFIYIFTGFNGLLHFISWSFYQVTTIAYVSMVCSFPIYFFPTHLMNSFHRNNYRSIKNTQYVIGIGLKYELLDIGHIYMFFPYFYILSYTVMLVFFFKLWISLSLFFLFYFFLENNEHDPSEKSKRPPKGKLLFSICIFIIHCQYLPKRLKLFIISRVQKNAKSASKFWRTILW